MSSMVSRFNWTQVSQSGILPSGCSLIQDSRPLQIMERKVLSEGKNGVPKSLRLTGLFQQADLRNANGRIYPHDVLDE